MEFVEGFWTVKAMIQNRAKNVVQILLWRGLFACTLGQDAWVSNRFLEVVWNVSHNTIWWVSSASSKRTVCPTATSTRRASASSARKGTRPIGLSSACSLQRPSVWSTTWLGTVSVATIQGFSWGTGVALTLSVFLALWATVRNVLMDFCWTKTLLYANWMTLTVVSSTKMEASARNARRGTLSIQKGDASSCRPIVWLPISWIKLALAARPDIFSWELHVQGQLSSKTVDSCLTVKPPALSAKTAIICPQGVVSRCPPSATAMTLLQGCAWAAKWATSTMEVSVGTPTAKIRTEIFVSSVSLILRFKLVGSVIFMIHIALKRPSFNVINACKGTIWTGSFALYCLLAVKLWPEGFVSFAEVSIKGLMGCAWSQLLAVEGIKSLPTVRSAFLAKWVST